MDDLIQLTHVPKGAVSEGVYLINYAEDQWNAYNEAGKQFCKDQWVKRATPTAAKYVVLRLIPDPVFPSGEREFPYIDWQQQLVKEPVRPWGVDCKVTVTVQDHIDETNLTVLAEIERYVQTVYPAGTLWEVFRPMRAGEGVGGAVIRRGKV